jgi:hypothetical protein
LLWHIISVRFIFCLQPFECIGGFSVTVIRVKVEMIIVKSVCLEIVVVKYKIAEVGGGCIMAVVVKCRLLKGKT